MKQTTAELVKHQFDTQTKTISIPVLAHRAGGTCVNKDDGITYVFEDGSRLITQGRGRSHAITTEAF